MKQIFFFQEKYLRGIIGGKKTIALCVKTFKRSLALALFGLFTLGAIGSANAQSMVATDVPTDMGFRAQIHVVSNTDPTFVKASIIGAQLGEINREYLVYPETVSWIGKVLGSDFQYSFIDVPITHIAYSGSDNLNHSSIYLKTVSFPSTVVEISAWAFQLKTQLHTVSLPASLKTIGGSAFRDCKSLPNIVFPAGLEKIKGYAFYQDSLLNNITIPDNVNEIGEYAFASCAALTSINIPAGMTYIDDWTSPLGAGAFWGCSNLQTVYYNAPNLLVSLNGIFTGCTALNTVIVGNNVKRLPNSGFYGTTISSVSLPEGLERIGATAFYDCANLNNVTLPSTLDTLGYRSFTNCASLTSITIPESVTYWEQYLRNGNGAFQNCTNLTSVTVNSAEVGDGAFSQCSNLQKVIFSENLTTIRLGAFDGCTSLTKLEIPASVVSINSATVQNANLNSTFNNCTGLQQVKVHWQTPLTNMGWNPFSGVTTSNVTLIVPRGTKAAYQAAPVWQDFSIIEDSESGNATPLKITAWCPAGNGKFANASNENTIAFDGTWPGSSYVATSYGLVPEGTTLDYNTLNGGAFIYLGDEPGDGTSPYKYFNVDFTALQETVAAGQYRIVVFAKDGDNDEEVFYSDAPVTVVEGDGYAYHLSATTVEVTSGGTVGDAGGTTLTLHLDLGVPLPVSVLPSDVLYFGIPGGADFSSATITSHPGFSISPFPTEGAPANNIRILFGSGPYSIIGGTVDIVISGVTALTAGESDAYIKFLRENPGNEASLGHWDGKITFDEAPANVQHSIALKTGVNWISTNVLNTNPTLLNQIKTSLATVGKQIMGNGKNLQKLGSIWTGTLTAISEKEMYKVNVTQDHTLILEGTLVDPQTAPVSLVANGWSWIGYTPAAAIPVGTALAGINAQVNDQIKTDTEFSTYTEETGWTGELTTMQPGVGYMYLSNDAAKTFTYPSNVTTSSMVRKSAEATVALRWTADRRRFADNMTVTAIVMDNETEVHSDLVEIAAFVGDECRGSVLLRYVEGVDKQYMGFLMISGETGDRLRFRVYDHGRQAEYNASGPVNTFTADGVYGNPLNPSAVTINSATAIDRINGALRIYPNPVKDILYIDCGQAPPERLEIYDLTGTLRHVETRFIASSPLQVSHLAPGIYMVRITINGETSVHKFIKQ
jgi:hypothetical protein